MKTKHCGKLLCDIPYGTKKEPGQCFCHCNNCQKTK